MQNSMDARAPILIVLAWELGPELPMPEDLAGTVLEGRFSTGVGRLLGYQPMEEGGPRMKQLLSHIQGLVPRPRGPNLGPAPFSVLHPQFCGHRSEEPVREAWCFPSFVGCSTRLPAFCSNAV